MIKALYTPRFRAALIFSVFLALLAIGMELALDALPVVQYEIPAMGEIR